MSNQPAPPPYTQSHKLLEGKNVVVTAAAGTGIGFAVAKLAAEEGARVLISDIHERRIGEAADRLEAEMWIQPKTGLATPSESNGIWRGGRDRTPHPCPPLPLGRGPMLGLHTCASDPSSPSRGSTLAAGRRWKRLCTPGRWRTT